ncbi:hypothetical protein [Microbacterium sp. K24]|uniref:hypothetical protein n=1 Tax=Microbacterium sp. K24 TaxID=2305446 RepID=UPI00109C9BD1|nr:hypothetical protein [Microbacterium sp. K24]
MPTPTTKPQDRKPKATAKVAPKPSEVVDAELEQAELFAELLADLPPMRPATRFRVRHRNDFANLVLDAAKSGAFAGEDSGPLEFDSAKPEDIERLQKLNEFVACIDEWAETIADDPEAYAEWSEGKTHDHFMALYITYRDALGESKSSAS